MTTRAPSCLTPSWRWTSSTWRERSSASYSLRFIESRAVAMGVIPPSSTVGGSVSPGSVAVSPGDTRSGADCHRRRLRCRRLARTAHDAPDEQQDRPEAEHARHTGHQPTDDRDDAERLEHDDPEQCAAVWPRRSRLLARAEQLLADEDRRDEESDERDQRQEPEQDPEAERRPHHGDDRDDRDDRDADGSEE